MSNAQSAGGKATAIVLRKKAEDIYNANPNYCLYCNKIIILSKGKKVNETRRKKFCNHTCSAIYNNLRKHKNPKKEKTERKKLCKLLLGVTKKQLILDRGYFNARAAISKHARVIYANSYKDKKCIICGYDKYIEISHIKSVSKFDNNSLVEDINNINNLMALCPNHHKEYDNGILRIKQV